MDRNKFTIEKILDLKEGKYITANDFFKKTEAEIFKFRNSCESDIQSKRKRFVCTMCNQPIKVRGQLIGINRMHFAHLKDSNDCPIKTGLKLSKEDVERIKYNGAKESELHKSLKMNLANCLRLNENHSKGVSNVLIEKVKKDFQFTRKWKKPDVSCEYGDFKLVFELQLSTTFLSVIVSRQEFYKRNQNFIFWVFHKFETNEDKRKFTQSDIFYSNNCNGFEFNEKAQSLSNEKDDLILCCHYFKPSIKEDSVVSEWQEEYVALNELTFDKLTYKLFYFNYEKEKLKLENELYLKNSRLISMIKSGTLEEMFSSILDQGVSDFELKEIQRMYKKSVMLFPGENILYNSLEHKIIWAYICARIEQKFDLRIFLNDFTTRKVLIDLLCLKVNKILGYKFSNLKQVVHGLLEHHPEYLNYFIRARGEYVFDVSDVNNKLRKKINRIRIDGVNQANENEMIDYLLPELKA